MRKWPLLSRFSNRCGCLAPHVAVDRNGRYNKHHCMLYVECFFPDRGPPNPPAESELQDSGLAPSKSLLFFWWPRQKTKWHD